MSIFGSLFEKKEAAPNPIRETLFGDMPLDAWPNGGETTDAMPWGAFVSARVRLQSGSQPDAVAWWRHILEQPGLEPRQYLQAWHFLRQHGEQPAPDVAKQILGVVVEVAIPKGLDLLAAYPDHSARYYNFSGAGIVWEHPDASLDAQIDQLFAAARRVSFIFSFRSHCPSVIPPPLEQQHHQPEGRERTPELPVRALRGRGGNADVLAELQFLARMNIALGSIE